GRPARASPPGTARGKNTSKTTNGKIWGGIRMRGKEVCRTLKEIRAEIARQNDIPWETEECTFEGACRGTCPRCEAEVRRLEEALAKRRRLCRAVALAGVVAGMV